MATIAVRLAVSALSHKPSSKTLDAFSLCAVDLDNIGEKNFDYVFKPYETGDSLNVREKPLKSANNRWHCLKETFETKRVGKGKESVSCLFVYGASFSNFVIFD